MGLSFSCLVVILYLYIYFKTSASIYGKKKALEKGTALQIYIYNLEGILKTYQHFLRGF